MSITNRSYDACVAQRLRPCIEAGDWQALTAVLNHLSNAQFRAAGNMLGGRLTDDMPEERFWTLFTTLVRHDARAFLGTMLKQVVARVNTHTLSLQSPSATSALQSLQENATDVQKTLGALLPLMKTPEEVDTLFLHLGQPNGEPRVAPLLRTDTRPAAYALLQALKYEEHDRPLLVRTAYYLIRRGDDLSFNLASLLRSYFGLDEVKGTFSLCLQPYQLARVADSYEAFAEII